MARTHSRDNIGKKVFIRVVHNGGDRFSVAPPDRAWREAKNASLGADRENVGFLLLVINHAKMAVVAFAEGDKIALLLGFYPHSIKMEWSDD